MIWSWLFYLLFAAVCVPGIGVQPRCCAVATCVSPCSDGAPNEFQLVISGLESTESSRCEECASLNGTYILTKQSGGDGDCCTWTYFDDGPCPAPIGEPDSNHIWIQLRVYASGSGGLFYSVYFSVRGAVPFYACSYDGDSLAFAAWLGQQFESLDCNQPDDMALTAVEPHVGSGADNACHDYWNSGTPPTALLTAL